MDPYQYCEAKAAKSGSSFYYSFRFLGKQQRQAVVAVYAFCREIDDIVDEIHEPSVAAVKLNWWRQQILALQDSPQHPVCQALAATQQLYQIPCSYFLDVITGMEMDLEKTRYKDFAELETYCYHAAGAVGLITAKILGCQQEETQSFAVKLGKALQLVNIIRDVGEDALRGRIYLPLADLAACKITVEEILQRQYSERFVAVMQLQAERARTFYQQALQILPDGDRSHQAISLIMAEIYFQLLTEIESDHFQVLNAKTALTPIRKLWIAWKTYRREKKRGTKALA